MVAKTQQMSTTLASKSAVQRDPSLTVTVGAQPFLVKFSAFILGFGFKNMLQEHVD